MKTNNKTILIIGFVIVIVLFLVFGGMAMTGSRLNGGMMGGWMMGGVSWMWIPIAITLGLGIILGWAIFGKK
jgi:heme/copper-type cytochrome/quinol oxidase subunit 2